MSDIFNQVEEELRQDQMKALWRRYGAYVIGAAVAIVLATFGNQLWISYSANKNAAASAAFMQAADAVKSGDIAAFDPVIEGAHGGYAALAGFAKADALLAQSDVKGAVDVLDGLSGKSGLPASLRDLAGLKAAIILMDSGTVDEVSVRLAPLALDGRPYQYAATEAQAFNAYRNGQIDEARREFEALAADFAAPQPIRSRATEMSVILGPALAAAQSADPALSSDDATNDAAIEAAQENKDGADAE